MPPHRRTARGAEVLAAVHRLNDSASFRDVSRRGRRRSCGSVVVHVDSGGADSSEPVVGLVVSKAVGNAVVRTQVKRRLRHQVAPLLVRLPLGARVVVRALPSAAAASSATLGRDLAVALRPHLLDESTGR